jgi:hypothetical protein
MAKDGELWHLVEARRDDGSPTIFRIRELEVRPQQTRIFVAELPYPVSELSKLPDAPSYRRFATFEEQWLDPACNALGWTAVAVKIEDGSFFVYLYGAGDPQQLVERLSPFDGELGFFDEEDATWAEYAALKELLDEAKTMPQRNDDDDDDAVPEEIDDAAATTIEHTNVTTKRAPPRKKPKKKSKAAAKTKTKAKAKPMSTAKPKKKPATKKPAKRKARKR